MPNRTIKESCTRSKTLDALSAEAERLFWRLTTVADDYGRFDADPVVVKHTCFKKREDIRSQAVEKWLLELSVGDDPAIQLYEVEGESFGAFRKWSAHQRTRQGKPKFPEPPPFAASRGELPQVAASRGLIRERIRERERERYTVNSPPAALRAGFDSFWHKYPKHKAKAAAWAAWRKLSPNEQLQGVILASLEQAKTSDDWLKESGHYIPHAATWLRGERWEDEHSPRCKRCNGKGIYTSATGYEIRCECGK